MTSTPSTTSRATLRYTAMRLGLFAASFAVVSVLAYVGVIPEGIGKSNPLWLVALAILISAPLSLVLLRRQRDEMSEHIAPRVERVSGAMKARLAANRNQEDDVA
ncbi:DUF4229 domain-containing protein [Streptomyces sp. JJ38]|uniref:DUF4229 domain-containing protein n=1 Tax=Streptomyces sp. JJ38 TaxID=2738128 RepID=UPI0027E1100A|nr:DUF4229 domain-containing protein [Streptomyces sp. JJ38]